MGVGSILGVPYSKEQEITQQSSTEREKSLALENYWVNTDPEASWEKLAWGLYRWGEERALAVTKRYLQQGMCSYCPAEISVYMKLDVCYCTLACYHWVVLVHFK